MNKATFPFGSREDKWVVYLWALGLLTMGIFEFRFKAISYRDFDRDIENVHIVFIARVVETHPRSRRIFPFEPRPLKGALANFLMSNTPWPPNFVGI
jgi:hypothetical protein